MLSNLDLFRLADHYRVPLATVCLRTELPRGGPQHGLTIINLDDGSQGGTHWTCYYSDGGSQGVYFDSFGAVPPPEAMRWAKRGRRSPVSYNAWICQDLKSQTCGWFCLAYGCFLAHNPAGRAPGRRRQPVRQPVRGRHQTERRPSVPLPRRGRAPPRGLKGLEGEMGEVWEAYFELCA